MSRDLTEKEWEEYMEFVKESNEKRLKLETRRRKRKAVIDIPLTDVGDMWDYEYQAKNTLAEPLQIIASNSLTNLKAEIKLRGWKIAWITCKTGTMSYGQNLVDEYHYEPKYR